MMHGNWDVQGQIAQIIQEMDYLFQPTTRQAFTVQTPYPEGQIVSGIGADDICNI